MAINLYFGALTAKQEGAEIKEKFCRLGMSLCKCAKRQKLESNGKNETPCQARDYRSDSGLAG